jgi:hypothetical protein
MYFLMFMLPYIAFVFLSVPIHELGHLIFGLMTGYSLIVTGVELCAIA